MAPGGENIPRLYTRTGDRGTTGLAHGGRIDKDSARIRAYGTLDELGAWLGRIPGEMPPNLPRAADLLRRLQHELFIAQSELATAPGARAPEHRIEARHVRRLEEDIDHFDSLHPPLASFVLPTGATAAADLHVARTVARRAERELVALHRTDPVSPEILQWVNRLSDLLFALALAVNATLDVPETPPDYRV